VATGVVAWLIAAAVATAVGIAAVSAIGNGIVGSGPQPLTQSEVNAQLAAKPAPPTTAPTTTVPTATEPATSGPANTGPTKVLPVQGGTIIARCVAAGVQVLSATPAQGYQVTSEGEVDDHPKVRFTSGRTEIEVRLRCVAGTPQPEVQTKH
jgi:hypothetical protein